MQAFLLAAGPRFSIFHSIIRSNHSFLRTRIQMEKISMLGLGTGGLLLLACLGCWPQVQAAEGIKLRKAVIPLFTQAPQPVLVAVITIDQAAPEPRRLGFFKIAACPKFVLEGVHVTIRQPEGLRDFLRNLTDRLNSLAGAVPWEIRRLEITVGAPGSCRLQARRARPDPTSITPTLLLDHIQYGTQSMEAAHGQLSASCNAADLRLSLTRNNQPIEYDLLADTPASASRQQSPIDL